MLFTQSIFFVFMAAVLAGLLVLRRGEHKILWLIGAGAFFYGWWDWRFLTLLAFTATFDFHLGLAIGRAAQPLRKRLLILDIGVNLGILCVFKYANFFLDSLSILTAPAGVSFSSLHIILPLGISFFVFEAMSYCIDIYRGNLQPYTNWRHFALFMFFFPRMIAGPIIRAADFLPQLQRDIRVTWPNFCAGFQLFLVGLTKKLVIADNLAPFADLVFANPAQYSGGAIWQAVLAYSIQIFCDFSGYSDMAIGLARMMGFELPANFNLPYLATNLTEFWRRWHISLSSWLRDYLYISLGGNRRGETRTYCNLLITMILGGLWHGASWNFALWGALHGLGLCVHKLWSGFFKARGVRSKSAAGVIIGGAASWLFTFGFVCFCWIFFRAPSFSDALLMLNKMLGGPGMQWLSGAFLVIAPVVVVAHFAGATLQRKGLSPALDWNRFAHLVLLFSWILGIIFLRSVEISPFIYFQF